MTRGIPRRRVACAAACVFVLLGIANRVDARQSDEDVGAWLGGFMNGRLPPSMNDDKGSWRLWLDVQVRFGDDASQFAQGLIRPGIGRTLGRGWTVWGGYAYVRTEPPYARSNTNEQRIWEQAIWSGKAGQAALSSRTRLEQRFLSTGHDTGWRLREFVKVAQPVGTARRWSVVVSDEYFVNLNSTDFGAASGSDRNRFFVGPSLSLGTGKFVEIGYLNQHTFRTNGPDKNDHVLATNLFWNF